MNFERGKSVAEALDIGRSKDAVKIDGVFINVHKWGGEDPEPSIGRYFKSEKTMEFEVDLSQAHHFLDLVIKQDTKVLSKVLDTILKEYSPLETILFIVLFQIPGDEKDSIPHLSGFGGKVFFKDAGGYDISIAGKLLAIPEGRLIKNSDFQIHLNGTGIHTPRERFIKPSILK
jgi:hypothetical protein